MESYHTARELIREMAFDEGIPVEDLLKSEYLAKSDIELFRKVKKKKKFRVYSGYPVFDTFGPIYR